VPVRLTAAGQRTHRPLRNAPTKKLVDMRLSRLRPHPRQSSLYAPRKRSQVDGLMVSMAKNGLDGAVEITPDGTIISGHCRLAAGSSPAPRISTFNELVQIQCFHLLSSRYTVCNRR
jgi:hypothetical protein